MTKAQAYDVARQEFYDLRYREEVERRVAKEEALATGAYFGMSYLEVGTLLEDKWYEEWKDWAKQETLTAQQAGKSNYAGPDAEASDTQNTEPATNAEGAEDLSGDSKA
jgi:small subunit ribosomal protein S23